MCSELTEFLPLLWLRGVNAKPIIVIFFFFVNNFLFS